MQAAVLTTIGTVYREVQLEEADTLLAEAVVIAGIDPIHRASALEERGTLRLHQGEYAAADSLYQDALRLQIEVFAPEHDDIAAMYTALGVVHRYEVEYPETEVHFRRAIAI